ncbi:MAG: 50S ribosomal protein L15 [Planctomycetes bacterium]|nr:50S ribosomal protein L15 [Planctomycetota bacterium]
MNITDVLNRATKHKARKRVGRGAASGQGKTSGSGEKGLGARSGANFLIGYVGGQKRLMERIPKRGFNNAVFAKTYAPVNLAMLEERFADGETVDLKTLADKGVTLRRSDKIKILGNGELSKKLTVKANAFSKVAIEKIEKAGGTAEVIK